MFKQGKKILLGAGVLAALSFGGSALAAAGAAPVAPIVQQSSGADHDEVQSGDQTTPDTGAAGAEATNSAQGTQDAETADGSQDAETQDGNQGSNDSGTQESSGSEVPGNDGPGGHADEPGNPNADHQASGQSQE
ncbi:MAG TPA: hypothetical protein VKC63_03230 [Solirubrobacterales bacterium]|nr:hypothetical protein [Solirubrobacterales bacterium]